MESPSFGAGREGGLSEEARAERAGRNRSLHVVSSQGRETNGRYPYRSALPMRLPRTAQGRANRRDWWIAYVIVPALLAAGALLLIVAEWRHP
jgi:hypothetical protein